MSLNLSIRGLGLSGGGGNPPAFNVSFTGLSTDSLGTYGQIGNHAAISYTITPDLTTETVKWSNSSNPADAATFGTGASPTDFTSVDGFRVYLHVTDDPVDDPDVGPVTRSFSFLVRYAPGEFAALVSQPLVQNSGSSTYTFAAATGANLTWTYSLLTAPGGVTLDGPARTVTFDTDVMGSSAGAYTVVATDQYGRAIQRSDAFTFVEPSIIAITSTGEQDGSGDVAMGYTIDRDDLGVRVVVYPANEPVPMAADFFNNSLTYNYEGTVALTADGGTIDFDVTGAFFGLVRIALLPTGGDDAAVAVSPPVLLDTTAPEVSSTSPTSGATRVPTDARLTMVFTEPMKQQGTVELRNVGGALIESYNAASVGTWSSGDTVWSHRPTADFVEAAELCVRWSGMEDTKGNLLADGVGDAAWAFDVGQWVFSEATIVDSPETSLPILSGTLIVIG